MYTVVECTEFRDIVHLFVLAEYVAVSSFRYRELAKHLPNHNVNRYDVTFK